MVHQQHRRRAREQRREEGNAVVNIEDAVEAARTLTRFTAPFNFTGLPALSLPCGFTASGLPIGLQVVGGHWREADVLRAGEAFEQATEWHLRKPPL